MKRQYELRIITIENKIDNFALRLCRVFLLVKWGIYILYKMLCQFVDNGEAKGIQCIGF